MTMRKRAAAVFVLTLLVLPALGGIAFAQLGTTDPGVTVKEGAGENCNGVLPPNDGGNTLKTLIGGDLVPGGTALFRISYPLEPDAVGEEWVVTDCVLVGDGPDLKKYDELFKAEFSGVAANQNFVLNLTVSIPDDIALGSTICNVAKTTAGPTAPQKSFRKAGPACFVVGGEARVEKQDPDGNILPGATFEISNCTNVAPDPALQPILVSPAPDPGPVEGTVVATEGFIAFNGPAGSTCDVTEVIPPPGYSLPPPEEATRTVEIGGSGGTIIFVDTPLEPAILVTKECTGSAHIGDDIIYSITVENTGNEPLENLVVDDTLLGVLGGFPSTLGVGDSVSLDFPRTVLDTDPDPLQNTVTATADGVETGQTVESTDSCESDVLHVPDIDVSKSCTGSALIGEEVIYTITVENTGNEPLENVVVDDSLLGVLGGFPSTLDVGQVVSLEFARTVLDTDPDPLPNTVIATATGVDSGDSVDDTARCESDIIHEPGIAVSKACTGPVVVGENVIYTIEVTNTGNEPLVGLQVDDSLLGLLGTFPDTLDVGQTVSLDFPREVLAGDPDPVFNVVTATATGADSQEAVEETATCSSDILRPAIRIDKTGPALAHVGDTITYTFVVTNVGEVPLEQVAVTDPLCDAAPEFQSGDVNENGLLELVEIWAYSCTHVVAVGDGDPVPNTATVTGQDRGGNPVTDSDDHLVDIINPAILIVKTASIESGAPGAGITYTYLVTNIGDTPLFNVSVDDDKLGHIGDIASLGVGESATLTADATLGAALLVNVATATGADELGKKVSDTDDATVIPVLPEEFPKTGLDGLGSIAATGWGFLAVGVLLVAGSRRRSPVSALAGRSVLVPLIAGWSLLRSEVSVPRRSSGQRRWGRPRRAGPG